MFGDDSSSWLDDIGGVLGISTPKAEEEEVRQTDGEIEEEEVMMGGEVEEEEVMMGGEVEEEEVMMGGEIEEEEVMMGGEGEEEEVMMGTVDASAAAGSPAEEPSWWERAADWVSGDDDEEAATGDGSDNGSGVDNPLDSVLSLFGIGDDEDEGDETVDAKEDDDAGTDDGQHDPESDDGETTVGDDPDDSYNDPESADPDDPWRYYLLAVCQRAHLLKAQVQELETISDKGDGGKMADHGKESLAQDVYAFNGACQQAKDSWSTLDDAQKGDLVFQLEDEAAILESLMASYDGELGEYGGSFAARAAIIASSISELKGDVGTAEQILYSDMKKVEAIKRGIKIAQIESAVNLTVGVVTTALGAFPPTAILGSAISAAQMATDPTALGATGLATDLAGDLGKSNAFISKATPVAGTALNAYGVIDQAIKDRAALKTKLTELKGALARVEQSTGRLISLMQKFNTKLTQAISYANQATGVSY